MKLSSTHRWMLAIASAILMTVALGSSGTVAEASGAATLSTDVVAADALELQGSCGDTRCNPPEDCHSCPADCGSCCGNGRCEPPEDENSCPRDCDE